VVAVGTLPGLGDSSRPLADAARHVLGNGAGAFMVVGAMLSILGVAHTIVLAAGRLPFAMAEQGQLPPLVATIHPRYRTPWVSLLFSSACLLVITLGSSFVSAATFTVEIRIMTYLITCAALPVLRRKGGAAGFVVPGGIAISVLGIGVCAYLLTTRPEKEIWQMAGAIGVGILLYFAGNVRRKT
jgi:amino acid transporter